MQFCGILIEPTGPVRSLQANATYYNTVVLVWRRPKKEHINSPGIRYALQYRQVDASPSAAALQGGIKSKQTACAEDSDSAAWRSVGECNQLRAVVFNGSNNLQLCQFHNSLRAFTEYQFRVFPNNSKGLGPPACASVRTLESAPQRPPSSVSCKTVSRSKVQLKWVAPEVSSINGVITSYQVQVVSAERKLRWDETGMVEKDTPVTEAVVDQLQPFRNYSFTVTVSNSRGRSAPSMPVFCRTRAAAPAPPRHVKLAQQSDSCFVASWVHCPSARGRLTNYTLRLTAAAEQVLQQTVPVDLSRPYQRHRLCLSSPAPPDVQFQLQVRSENHAMEGVEWSPIAVFTASGAARRRAHIVSFSRRVVLPHARATAELDCEVVGGASTDARWIPGPSTHLGTRLERRDANLVLILTHVRRATEFVCRVASAEIRYQVAILARRRALPKPPRLLTGRVTSSSLEVKWRTHGFQDDGARRLADASLRVRAFRLNFTNYLNGSHTETRELDSGKRSYLIDPVACGALYGFRVAALNRVGWSGWSAERQLRTRGRAPIAPRHVAPLRGELHSVRLNLSTVEPGEGCPAALFHIWFHNTLGGRRLRPAAARHVVVRAQQLRDGCFSLTGLNAATHYVYRVTALNAAGNATFGGYFYTTTRFGERPADPQQRRVDEVTTARAAWRSDVLIPIILVFIVLVLLVAALLLYFKRHALTQLYEGAKASAVSEPQPALDNPWGHKPPPAPVQEDVYEEDEGALSDTGSWDSQGNLNFYAMGTSSQETDQAPRDLRRCQEERSQLQQRMQCSIYSRHKIGAARHQQQEERRHQAERLAAQRASHLSSVTTVSTNHDELSELYHYGLRNPLGTIDYEDSRHTSASSETTDSGIRRFTQVTIRLLC